MEFSFEGIDHMAITVRAGNGTVGQVCTLDTRGATTQCAAGGHFCGVVESVKGNMACMQVEGFVKQNYTGTTPGYGYVGLAADGNGGVKADTNGIKYLVVEVNPIHQTIVFKL